MLPGRALRLPLILCVVHSSPTADTGIPHFSGEMQTDARSQSQSQSLRRGDVFLVPAGVAVRLEAAATKARCSLSSARRIISDPPPPASVFISSRLGTIFCLLRHRGASRTTLAIRIRNIHADHVSKFSVSAARRACLQHGRWQRNVTCSLGLAAGSAAHATNSNGKVSKRRPHAQ